MTKMSSCHPERPVRAKGLCLICYEHTPNRSAKRKARAKIYYVKNKERIKETSKKRRIKFKEELKDYFKSYYTQNKIADPLKFLLTSAKARSVAKNLEFTISKEDVTIPEYCPVLGIKLLYGNTGKLKPESASFDRFDNSKGYIPGNVRIISTHANHLKSNGTLEDFKNIIKYMES